MEIPSERIKYILESLLFVGRKPLPVKEIVEVLNRSALGPALNQFGSGQAHKFTEEEITALLEELVRAYEGRGINIVKVAGGYLMGTNPANADYVHGLLHAKVQTSLTPQALETLSVVAYKQPVTRAEIERIRGVNSDGPIDTLLQKKLIQELGRSDAVGRPYLFGTTIEFLRHFGLKDLSDLPPLPVSEEEQDALFKSALHE